MCLRNCLFSLLTVALPFAAQAQNILLPVQGLLTDLEDQEIEGAKTLEFELIDAAGETAWQGFVTTEIVGGLFTVYLGQDSELPASIFADNSELSLKMSLNGSVLGAWPVGSAAYAAFATYAANAGDAATLEGQGADAFAAADHTHTVAAGAGLAVDEDGNLSLAAGGITAANLGDLGCEAEQLLKWGDNGWACAEDLVLTQEQVENYARDVGYDTAEELHAVLDARYVQGPQQNCEAGQILKRGQDGWGCADDNNDDTDTQLNEEQVDTMVGNNDFVVGPAQACGADQLLKYGDNGWACADDNNDDTRYSGGSGITLGNDNSFYIGAGAINQTHLGRDSVRANELADNSVDMAAMTDNSVGAAEIVNNSIGRLEMGDDAVGNSSMQDDAVNTAELVNGAVTRAKLGPSGCSDGQILKYSDNGWLCSADMDTNTTYTGGSGITLGNDRSFYIAPGAIGQGHLAADSVRANELADNSVDMAAMTDNSVGAAEIADNSIGRLEMGDNAVGNSSMQNDAINTAELVNGAVTRAKLNASGCVNGQILKYNNGWVCSSDIDTNTQLNQTQVDAMVANNGYASTSDLHTVATSGLFADLDAVPAGLADGDDNTTYSSGTGLSLNGGVFAVVSSDVQTRVSGTCPVGSSIRVIAEDGSVTCESDSNTEYGAAVSGGLSVSNRQFSIAADGVTTARIVDDAVTLDKLGMSCANNYILKHDTADGGSWRCAADVDTNTTYSVSAPLSATGTVFTVGVDAILAGHLADDSVTAGELADDAVDTAAIADDAVTFAKIDSPNSCSGNRVMVLTTNGWGCSSIGHGLSHVNNNLYTNSAIIQKRVAESCGAGSSIRAIAQSGGVTCEADSTRDAGAGLTLTVNTFSVDTSTIQARVSGSCGANQSIKSINADGTVICETDDNTTYVSGQGLTLSGNSFSIATDSIGAGLLGVDSVEASELANNSVASLNVIDNSLTSYDLGVDSVKASELANNSVASANIINNTIVNGDINASAAISPGKLNYPNEVYVGGGGTDTANGTALRSAIIDINASATNRKLIRVGPGTFDLGINYLYLDDGLTIEGSGMRSTHIISSRIGSYVLRGQLGAVVKDLHIQNRMLSTTFSWSHVVYNSSANDTRTREGDAFKVTNCYLNFSGNSDRSNTLIYNLGDMEIRDSRLYNGTGGTGDSHGIYAYGSLDRTAKTYIYGTHIYVNNYGTSTGLKVGVTASRKAWVEFHHSSIEQNATDAGTGVGLDSDNYAHIHSFNSIIDAKTSATDHSLSGEIAIFGGRMRNSEHANTKCSGVRAIYATTSSYNFRLLNHNCDFWNASYQLQQ